MFVDNKFYNDVYRMSKKSFMKYFILYLFLQLLLTTLPELTAIQMISAGTINPFSFTEVAHTSFLLSFSCSIIMQFFTLLILMQIFRIIQGSYTKLIDLFEPLREKWLIILCISAFIAFLDNLFTHNISNTILLVILKLALYYLTIIAIIFPILRTIFGGSLLLPLVALDNPSALNTLSKSMMPLFTAMFIAILLVSILTQYRLFCAYYAHALYYFKKYVEIKPDESETLTQSTESTYMIDKNEDA